MKLRLIVLALMLTLVGACVGPAHASAATQPSTGASGSATTQLPDLNPFAVTHVTGTARPLSRTAAATAAAPDSAPSGTFIGRVTILRFAALGGHLVAQVAVRGTVTTASGAQPISTVATTPAAVSTDPMTCTVLNLTLAPLHLNLLGVVVDTSQINVTITGQTGPGMLLGNLVCGIANLLNSGGPLSVLANLFNALLLGTAEALLSTNTQFAVQNGQLVAITTLNGAVLATSPATVSTAPPGPNAPAGACTVLSLTLGPLHLDLLGLIIDLNGGVDSNGNALPITVTITGVPGPGNLLGNLVCDIANLLNQGNLNGVAYLLNVLMGLLRL